MSKCHQPKFSELYQQKYLDAFPPHPLSELDETQEKLLWELSILVNDISLESNTLKFGVPDIEDGDLEKYNEAIEYLKIAAEKGQARWGDWDIEDCVNELHEIERETGKNGYSIEAEKLTLKCAVFLLLYPFWSRMDGSFEKDFALDGRLGKYLRILKEKDFWEES